MLNISFLFLEHLSISNHKFLKVTQPFSKISIKITQDIKDFLKFFLNLDMLL